VGRSGQQTLVKLLNCCLDDAYSAFESPTIDTIFKGKLSRIERKIRRKYFETHDLLGRGSVLKAYDNNNISFINNIALKRVDMINKKLDSENKSIYIDVSKHFAKGLHIGFCNVLPEISIINLVRDPLMNMKSFINRQKNFILDNNIPDSSSNILQLRSLDMTQEEFYLWAWCEIYLRFQYLKKKMCVSGYTEIFTEKLNNGDYLAESLGLIDLQYNLGNHTNQNINTNTGKGYDSTCVSQKDIDIFYKFLEKIPSNLIKKIPYLNDYHPEKHIT
jgi:hypothetical protein